MMWAGRRLGSGSTTEIKKCVEASTQEVLEKLLRYLQFTHAFIYTYVTTQEYKYLESNYSVRETHMLHIHT